MRFLDLEPKFLRIVDPKTWSWEGTSGSDVPIAEAQGVMFLCPKCFEGNAHSSVGVHSVVCWFLGRGVSDAEEPGPGRWEPIGTGLADLTLHAGSSSVLLRGECDAHFFVRDGEVLMC